MMTLFLVPPVIWLFLGLFLRNPVQYELGGTHCLVHLHCAQMGQVLMINWWGWCWWRQRLNSSPSSVWLESESSLVHRARSDDLASSTISGTMFSWSSYISYFLFVRRTFVTNWLPLTIKSNWRTFVRKKVTSDWKNS